MTASIWVSISLSENGLTNQRGLFDIAGEVGNVGLAVSRVMFAKV